MRRLKRALISGAALVLVCAGVWFFLGERRSQVAVLLRLAFLAPAFVRAQSERNLPSGTPPPKPARIYGTYGKPETPEIRSMIQWYTYWCIADPRFEWRSPIDFYGKVVDETGQPVPAAGVDLEWTSTRGTEHRSVQSGADGRFELVGAQGKNLGVQVFKPGYNSGASEGRGSFEYSAFYQAEYHQPDREHPVLFKLTSLASAEPMYFWRSYSRLPLDGSNQWLDLNTGKFGKTGQVGFSTRRTPPDGDFQSDWTVAIDVPTAGGVILNPERYTLMTTAPETGYASHWQAEFRHDAPQFRIGEAFRFYVQTPDARFAAIELEITQLPDAQAKLKVVAYFNPSGSRNLRFDQNKQINPP